MREYLVGVISYTIVGTIIIVINNLWVKYQQNKILKKMYKLKEDTLKEIETEIKFAQSLLKDIYKVLIVKG